MTSVIIAAAEPQKLDNRIKTVEVQSEGFTHYADNSNVRAEFIADANAVVFESRGRRIKWTPRSIKYVDAWGMEDTIYSVQNVPLEIKANYARFNRAFPDVDDWFIVENDRLKHQILVQGFQRDPFELLDPATTEFVVSGALSFDADLAVRADGMALTGAFETSGGIEILDGENIVFTLPRIIAKDSHFEKRAVAYGKYRVTANEGGVLAFDIVMDNEWIASEERVYPIVIDPTIVSNSSSDPIALGSQIVKRVPGTNTLYALVLNRATVSTYLAYNLYRSTDNGVTWALVAALPDAHTLTGTINRNEMSDGTIEVTAAGEVYIFAYQYVTNTNSVGQSNNAIFYYSGTGTSISAKSVGSVGAVTASCGCVDANGNVWFLVNGAITKAVAIFVPKTNVTSAAQFDTGATSSYTFRTAFWDAGLSAIVCAVNYSTSTPTYIGGFAKITPNSATSPSSVAFAFIVTKSSTSAQTHTGVARLANGNVLFTWAHGATSTVNAAEYTNTGTLISTKTVAAPPSPLVNIGGNRALTVVSDGSTWHLFAHIGTSTAAASLAYSAAGAAWQTLYTTTAYASVSQLSVYGVNAQTNLDYAYMPYSSPGTTVTLSYDKISLNTAPLAPSALSRPNYDATTTATFTYQFNDTVGDTLSAHEAEIVDTATGNVVYALAKTGTTTSSFTVAANTLTNGKTYQWRVRTYDAGGLQSPWSAYASLKCAVAPQVAVTDPAAYQLVSGDSITVSGSYVQSAGSPQKSFRFRLYSATDALLQDSGEIAGATNTKTFAGLANNTTYKVDFTATSNDDIAATSAKVSFSVQYTPPATPTVTATNNSEVATVIVTFANPAPVGDQPAAARNDVFRRKVGATDWTIIASGAISPYTDRTCPAGAYEYGVRAVATSGAVSEYGTAQVAHSFAGHRIVDEATGETLAFVYNVDGADITIEDDSQAIKTFGGVFVRRTPNRYKRGTLAALYVDSAEDVMARVEALDRMAASDSLYLLKLSHGEAFKVSLSRVRYKAQHAGMTADVSVEWTKGGVE